jgi:hypothetical protein
MHILSYKHAKSDPETKDTSWFNSETLGEVLNGKELGPTVTTLIGLHNSAKNLELKTKMMESSGCPSLIT